MTTSSSSLGMRSTSSGVSSRLRPWPPSDGIGGYLRYGNGLAHGHGGVDLHRHITAPRGEVLGADLIGTAQHELHVQVTDDLRPEIVGIPVLELTEALHGQHHIDRTAADNAERTGEIRTVRCATELAHIVELIEDEVDRDFAAQLRVLSA